VTPCLPSPRNTLLTSGIYSERDKEKLQSHHVSGRKIVLYIITQDYTGQNILENPESLHNLLDEEALNRIYVSTASKI